MVISSPYKPDGFQVIARGINSGWPANTLSRDQLAFATNATFRSGFPEQRPPWFRKPLTFLNQEGLEDATLKARFEDGLFQGATAFQRTNMLVASVGGRMFAIDLDKFAVSEVSIANDLDRPDFRRVWFAELEDFIIRQDGQARPIIFDGAKSKRSESFGVKPQIPCGTVMEYSNGRLAVALPDRHSFVIGDLIYGSSGTTSHGGRDAVLYFTENDVIAEGGAFPIPLNAGKITAMRGIAQLDTSQGQGPLQVFVDRGSFSVNAPPDRTQWQKVNFPIQSVSLIGSGPVSYWSTVNVNGDIWFRSNDGVRSFQVSRRDNGTWVNTAFSKEVERPLLEDDTTHLGWSSGALFDNRLLMTTQPYRNFDHGVVWRGLVALDFNPSGTISTTRVPPIWEGVWEGLNILQIVSGTFKGIERAFLFVLSDEEKIELWELQRSGEFDYDGTQWQRIHWQLEGASYNWPDSGWGLKSLETGDVWYDQIADLVEFSIEYRPDQEPNWQSWHTWSSSAAAFTCATANPISNCAGAPLTLATQARQRKRFPRPPEPAEDCNVPNARPNRYGFEFQPRLTILGAARIKKFRLWALPQPEDVEGACESMV